MDTANPLLVGVLASVLVLLPLALGALLLAVTVAGVCTYVSLWLVERSNNRG